MRLEKRRNLFDIAESAAVRVGTYLELCARTDKLDPNRKTARWPCWTESHRCCALWARADRTGPTGRLSVRLSVRLSPGNHLYKHQKCPNSTPHPNGLASGGEIRLSPAPLGGLIKGDDGNSLMSVPRKPISILQLNSILCSGGTDRSTLHLAENLLRLGQRVWMGGPPIASGRTNAGKWGFLCIRSRGKAHLN